jgi:hypothetical protein
MLIVLASISLVVVHVPKHMAVSPIDEYVYIDYYAKVLDKGVVVRGEETGEYAREYLACHGVRAIGTYPEALCRLGGGGPDEQYPYLGVTSADLYTPAYFAVTRVLAEPLIWAGVEQTEAGRYVGAVWLAGGAVLLYFAIRRFGAGRLVATGLSLLAVGSLPAYWSNTYISTDATAVLAGALMLLLAVPMLSSVRTSSIVALSAAAVLVTTLKLQNLLAVGVVAAWLIAVAFVAAWRAGSSARERVRLWVRDRRSIAAICAVVSGLLAQAVWVIMRSMLAIGPQPDQGVGVPFSKRAAFAELFKFFPGVASGAVAPQATGELGPALAAILTVVIAAGVVGIAVRARSGSNEQALGMTVLVFSVVAAPALAVANVIVGGFYFVLPARYGSALIPAMLLCAAALFTSEKRWVAPAVMAVGAVAVAMSLALTES